MALSGKIQTGSYEDSDGKKVYTTDVIIEGVDFIRNQSAEENKLKQSSIFDEGDLPF